MLESFEKNVWSLRFRCMNCHTEGTPQNDKLVKEYGDRVAWFKKAGPEATMEYLLASKLIDLDKPDKSLLLTKPLERGEARRRDQVRGRRSGLQGDPRVGRGRGRDQDGEVREGRGPAAEGHRPKQFGTEAWLKLEKTPDAWADKLLTVEVFAWDAKASGVGEGTDRDLRPRGVRQGEAVAAHAHAAGPGRVGAREGVGAGETGAARGQVSGEGVRGFGREGEEGLEGEARRGRVRRGRSRFQARWREGYGAMTVVDASRAKR